MNFGAFILYVVTPTYSGAIENLLINKQIQIIGIMSLVS